MKLFNKTIDRQLFKQYSLGSDLSKQEVVAKIFNPTGAGTWFILNSDPQDPDHLWAIVDLGYGAEIGSVSRSELENYRGRFGLGFERDLSFDPINAEELYQGLRQGEYYSHGGETEERIKQELASLDPRIKLLSELSPKEEGYEGIKELVEKIEEQTGVNVVPIFTVPFAVTFPVIVTRLVTLTLPPTGK
jgi:hypothetical protein